MYVCNCRVAKVNDDDDVQCNTKCVGGCLVATTPPTRKYYQPPSLSHWQNAEMSCKYDRTPTTYSLSSPSLSPFLSLYLVLPTTNITNLNLE